MTQPSDPQPRQHRYSAHHQARLDAETHAKLQELVAAFHRSHSAILRHVMQWGLTQTRGWTIEMVVPGTVHTLSMLLEPELLQQVHGAAKVQGATVAAWLRQAMREVTIDDFPGSWRAGVIGVRAHDSHTYGQRFMLRLDEITAQKLQELVDQVGRSRAEIIRQLIAQVSPDDFPESWRMAVDERRYVYEKRRSGPSTRSRRHEG